MKGPNNLDEKLRIDWNPYEKFSSDFLNKHCELVLWHIFHHVKAFLLFPADCLCSKPCLCHEQRQRVILSLNTERYNRHYLAHEEPNRLEAIKSLWSLPEDHVFRELYPYAYPLWAIENELKNLEESGDFQIINQLVWILLRSAQTYMVTIRTKEVSLTEATSMIGKDMPVKAKANDLLRGEKAYVALWNRYKSVCHFIAALEFCRDEEPQWDNFLETLYPPRECMQRFINVVQWFRKNLLLLKRRNVKNKVFLKEEELCPLPDWLQCEDIPIPIEPYEEKVKAILSTAKLIDPVTKMVIKEGLEIFS